MSQSKDVRFLPHEVAAKIVAAIQEEEDVDRPNHRVLTVYNHDDKEICWFDFDDVMKEIPPVDKSEEKEAVSEYIVRHIPDWVLDI